MMDVSELIPRRARLIGYVAVVLLGVLIGAVTVGFVTATGAVPLAVTVCQAVYGWLAGNAAVVALFNLNKPLVVDGEEYPLADELPADEAAPVAPAFDRTVS